MYNEDAEEEKRKMFYEKMRKMRSKRHSYEMLMLKRQTEKAKAEAGLIEARLISMRKARVLDEVEPEPCITESAHTKNRRIEMNRSTVETLLVVSMINTAMLIFAIYYIFRVN